MIKVISNSQRVIDVDHLDDSMLIGIEDSEGNKAFLAKVKPDLYAVLAITDYANSYSTASTGRSIVELYSYINKIDPNVGFYVFENKESIIYWLYKDIK